MADRTIKRMKPVKLKKPSPAKIPDPQPAKPREHPGTMKADITVFPAPKTFPKPAVNKVSRSAANKIPTSSTGRIFRPTAKTPASEAGSYKRVMKGLGFKPAHPVEGGYINPQGTSKPGVFSSAAKKILPVVQKNAPFAKMAGRAVGRGALIGGAVIGIHDIGVAAREGYKAVKAHADLRKTKSYNEKHYGTMAAAAKTRHSRRFK